MIQHDPKELVGAAGMVEQLAAMAPFAAVIIGTCGGTGVGVGLMYTDDCPDQIRGIGRGVVAKLQAALTQAEADVAEAVDET